MTRFAAFAGVMLTAGIATISFVEEPATHRPGAREVLQFDEKTTELVVNYTFFKTTLDSTLKELEGRRIGLRQAAYCVRDAAAVYCPIYLDRLKHAEQGGTDEERVARNLIGHLRDRESADARLIGRTAEVESELAAILQ